MCFKSLFFDRIAEFMGSMKLGTCDKVLFVARHSPSLPECMILYSSLDVEISSVSIACVYLLLGVDRKTCVYTIISDR